ncbi:MAG: CocE/NonD family hydrolase, partial [Pyrinomonadaceae bacterium]
MFAPEGYIFVYQDVRGRYMSEGDFINITPHKDKKNKPTDIDESSDTYDTVEWLLKNISSNNGRVGMWGISYPGFYVAADIINSHPAIKAASPQAPVSEWFIGDDFHHNGALFLPHSFNFLAIFGRPRPKPTTETPPNFNHGTPDGYKFFLEMGPLRNANEKYFKNDVSFWNEMTEHPNYDKFWQERSLIPHLNGIHAAVMTVGGWFDAEDLYGALHVYESIERKNPQIANTLVMGPWFHGGWSRADGDALGDIRFSSKTGEFYRQNIELPFFNYYLKEKGEAKLPEAYVFQTGLNEWKMFDNWPPKNTIQKSLYFQPQGRLSFDPPSEAGGYDEYVSDPNKPVPYVTNTATGMTREYM